MGKTKAPRPISIEVTQGLTVKRLRYLLEGANPEAVVYVDHPNWMKVTKASLDALPPGMGNRPCVKLS